MYIQLYNIYIYIYTVSDLAGQVEVSVQFHVLAPQHIVLTLSAGLLSAGLLSVEVSIMCSASDKLDRFGGEHMIYVSHDSVV